MNSQEQRASASGFAGFYVRLGGQARFWGWGAPPVLSAAQTPSADGDAGRPTVRIACDRHFIGLVVR